MSDPVITWAAVALVGVTAYYAIEASRSRRIAQKQLTSIIEPIITVGTLKRPNHMVYLRVANHGHSAALDVRFTVDKTIPTIAGIPLFTEEPLFTHGSDCIEPGAEYFYPLGGAPAVLGEDSVFPKSFAVTATYTWQNRSVSERSVVDVGSY